MKQNPVGWFEIYVADMPSARAFYEAVFAVELQPMQSVAGCEATEPFEMWLFPMADNSGELAGASGGLVKMANMSAGGNSTVVYFSCEDCAVQAGRAAEHGGKIFREKFSIGEHGFIALVFDTEGNMIGLHSMQ